VGRNLRRARSFSGMRGLYELSREELTGLLEGEPSYRTGQVWEALYVRCAEPSEMTELPGHLRTKLAQLPGSLEKSKESVADAGRTVKWLFSLGDGSRIETVLMLYGRRATVCVSTQAGCAMGCTFCATGQMGFMRHLEVGEILEQVVAARRAAAPRRVSNVVFMGMGEPLANYDRVLEAAHRMHSDMGISARHLTISTVGIVPGIRRLAQEGLAVNLAVSLHAANDELRDSLLPMNKRYPLSQLTQACGEYVDKTRRRLSFEWALIDQTNDRDSDAVELAEIARSLGAHVNLIPLNPTPGYPVRGSPRRRVAEFRAALETLGVNATVRSTRGSSIDAACGQLSVSP
jgi:23S rRNA (adenine2503-C2)-methyltransferase